MVAMTTRAYLPPGLPVPRPSPDGLDEPYWAAARRHELAVQRCAQCRAFQWEPEWMCVQCSAGDVGWETVTARGRIYSWERVWTSVHPALKEHGPYLVVCVELPAAGNVRMIGNLLGDPLQTVEFGASVE